MASVVLLSVVVVGIANFGQAVETLVSWVTPTKKAPQLVLRIIEPRITLDSVYLPTYVFNSSADTWRITNATLSNVPADFEARESPGYSWLRGSFDTVVIEPKKTVSFVVRGASGLLYWEGLCGLHPRIAVEYEFLGSGLRGLHGDPIVVTRLFPSRYPDLVEYRLSGATLEIPSGRLVASGAMGGSYPVQVGAISPSVTNNAATAHDSKVVAAYRRLRSSLRETEAERADSCASVIKRRAQAPLDSAGPVARRLPYYLIRVWPQWKDE